jgi:hypothetical protein
MTWAFSILSVPLKETNQVDSEKNSQPPLNRNKSLNKMPNVPSLSLRKQNKKDKQQSSELKEKQKLLILLVKH